MLRLLLLEISVDVMCRCVWFHDTGKHNILSQIRSWQTDLCVTN